MVSSESEGQLWIIVCLFLCVWMFQVATGHRLTLSPVFLVDSESGDLPISRRTNNSPGAYYDNDTQSVSFHWMVGTTQADCRDSARASWDTLIKSGRNETCENGWWRRAVCAGMMTESKLWPNGGSQWDFIIELSSTCQHICTCTLSVGGVVFFAFSFFGYMWTSLVTLGNTSCVTHNCTCTESAHFSPTFSTLTMEKNQLY